MENIADDLEVEIQRLISDITGVGMEDLKPEANFWEDLGIDSLKAIEITVAIEKKYKIRVRDEEVSRIVNLTQAVAVVKEALGKKGNE